MNGAWIVAVAGLLVAAQDAKKDTDKLQGTWVVQSLERGGQADPNSKGDTLTIQGDKFTVKMKNGEMKGTIKFDPDKTPKQLQFMVTEGQGQAGTSLGIYALEGDELKLCLGQIGGTERPKALASKEGENHLFIVLKRGKQP
jgi:uncharacterized protein (TIGR03067 family)